MRCSSARAPREVPDEMKPLIGTYYANFGPFKNTPFQVVVPLRTNWPWIFRVNWCTS